MKMLSAKWPPFCSSLNLLNNESTTINRIGCVQSVQLNQWNTSDIPFYFYFYFFKLGNILRRMFQYMVKSCQIIVSIETHCALQQNVRRKWSSQWVGAWRRQVITCTSGDFCRLKQTPVKHDSKFKHFDLRKSTWKFRLQNGSHFVHASTF